MQAAFLKTWDRRAHFTGGFNRYFVDGFQYEDQAGERGWHIVVYSANSRLHDYWISDKAFHSMSGPRYNRTNELRFNIDDAIVNVDPEEKQAVLMAIAEWEHSAICQ